MSDLASAPYNPREIDDDALAALKESLASFGDLSGIVWNAKTGHVVAGHQRLRALHERYGASLVLKADGDPRLEAGGSEWPIRVVDWDEEFEKLANLTANNPSVGGWYTDDLQGVIDGMEIEPEIMDALRIDELIVETIVHDETETLLDQAVQLRAPLEYVVIRCDNDAEWVALQAALSLEPVRRGGYRKGSAFDALGTQRVVKASKLLELLP